MIFDEQISRRPLVYPWAKEFGRALHISFWTVNEFNFQPDIQDFKVHLSEKEKDIITKTLAAIGQIECSVKTYYGNLGSNLKRPEFIDLGYIVANNEVIHADSYSRLLEVLGLEQAFEEILKLDIIKNRVNYLKKHNHKYHSDSKKQFVYSMILFSLFVENVSLFSQFYIINWFGKFKNYLSHTVKQTDYTAKEETIHSLIGMKIVNTIREEHPELFDEELQNKVLYEAKQAFKYESEIIDWILGDLTEEGINSALVKEFIKNRINQSLISIGYPSLFDIDEMLLDQTRWFDELVLGNGMTDFFSVRPVEYTKKDKSFSEEDLF